MNRRENPRLKRRDLFSSVRRLGRLARRIRFLLFDRGRHNRLVIEEVAGRSFLVLPGVFNPALFRSGEFLAEILKSTLIPSGAEVLDLGTGTGVAAVIAADRAEHVVAVDVVDKAARCARINVLLNGLEERVEVIRGDLFDRLDGKRFDLILFNPPYLRGDASTDLDFAFWSRDVVERFAGQLKDHLTERGFALVILSSDGPVADFLKAFGDCGIQHEKLAEKDLISEVLTVFRLTCPTTGAKISSPD